MSIMEMNLSYAFCRQESDTKSIYNLGPWIDPARVGVSSGVSHLRYFGGSVLKPMLANNGCCQSLPLAPRSRQSLFLAYLPPRRPRDSDEEHPLGLQLLLLKRKASNSLRGSRAGNQTIHENPRKPTSCGGRETHGTAAVSQKKTAEQNTSTCCGSKKLPFRPNGSLCLKRTLNSKATNLEPTLGAQHQPAL